MCLQTAVREAVVLHLDQIDDLKSDRDSIRVNLFFCLKI